MQFRFVQRTKSLFQVLIVAETSYLLRIRDDLIRQLHKKFPPIVRFEIIQVERMEPDPNGKFRMFISEVD